MVSVSRKTGTRFPETEHGKGCPNEMKNMKKLTILHSNDLHGDFTAEQVDEKLVGGVSLLSGYVNKVRSEEKNVIYTVIHMG